VFREQTILVCSHSCFAKNSRSIASAGLLRFKYSDLLNAESKVFRPNKVKNSSNYWYAARVRTGAESRLSTSLVQKGYEIFLPTYAATRSYSDRIKKIDAPLFPGYLFCKMDLIDRLPLVQTPGVVSIVSVGGVPSAVDDLEIEAIRRLMASNPPATPWPYLREGDTVLIQHGSLTGVSGIIVRARGQDRLVLSVHLLQRSISVEIERAWIRPEAETQSGSMVRK
jgi:transcription antitermination factor NusG